VEKLQLLHKPPAEAVALGWTKGTDGYYFYCSACQAIVELRKGRGRQRYVDKRVHDHINECFMTKCHLAKDAIPSGRVM